MEFTKSHRPEEAIRDSYDKWVPDFNHTEQNESGHVDTILFGGGGDGGGGRGLQTFRSPDHTNFVHKFPNDFQPISTDEVSEGKRKGYARATQQFFLPRTATLRKTNLRVQCLRHFLD